MKRIAFFLTSFNVGGIEKVFISFANELVHKMEVNIVVCNNKGALKETLSRDIFVHDMGGIRLKSSIFKLREILKREDFDYVIAGGDMVNIILIMSSLFLSVHTKIIISQHNFFDIEMKNLGSWSRFSLKLMKSLYPKADAIIAVSEGIQHFLINDLHIQQEKVRIVYNGINFDEVIQLSGEVVGETLPHDYIVYIGRLSLVKNIPLILNAFNRADIGNTELILIGDGDERKHLETLASDLLKYNQIHFIGAKTNPLPYLKRARALVLSSFSESFSMAVLEAIALDKNVVTTPTIGPMELLSSHDNCFISSNFDNVNEYANLIEKAVESDCTYSDETKSKFSIQNSISMLMKLMDELDY